MLTAGVSQLDVTPPLGTKLRGYFEERIASNVHDPLYVRSFAFEDSTSRRARIGVSARAPATAG